MTTKCSVTLLKKGVSDIGLRSSSHLGSGIFPIGVMYSFFQFLGQTAVCMILLIIPERGVASSTENSFVTWLGRSIGTPERGFLAASIFFQVPLH